ncbi:MAG: DUF4363 family protein [Clostridia bacterium]
MKRNIICTIIAILIVGFFGIFEVVVMSNLYKQLNVEATNLLELTIKEEITEEEAKQFQEKWKVLRERSELCLPHIDVYELNLRVAEAVACVEHKDYKSAHSQLAVVIELTEYIPHLMVPNIRHIV